MTGFLGLPHPYPQIAEMVGYDDDEVAEAVLRCALVMGLTSLMMDTSSGENKLCRSGLGPATLMLNEAHAREVSLAKGLMPRLASYAKDDPPF